MEVTLNPIAVKVLAESLGPAQETQLRSQLNQLVTLASSKFASGDLPTFLSDFANAVSNLFAATTVAIWFPDPDAFELTEPRPASSDSLTSVPWEPKVAIGWDHLRLDAPSSEAHLRLLHSVAAAGDCQCVLPFSSPRGFTEVANPTDAVVLLAPVIRQGGCLAMLEVALGPKPLRRPDASLVSAYLDWLRYLRNVLLDGICNHFATEVAAPPAADVVLEQAKSHVDDIKAKLLRDLEISVNALAGQDFGSLLENQRVAKQVHTLLDSVSLRVACPECGSAAILRCQKAGNAKHGVFTYDHYLEHGRTFHGGQTRFPALKLVPKPERRRKSL